MCFNVLNVEFFVDLIENLGVVCEVLEDKVSVNFFGMCFWIG